MASILYSNKTKRRAIQFVAGDGTRPKIRLGKVTRRQAQTAKCHIEELIASRTTGAAPKGPTAEWLAELPNRLRRRLEHLRLVEPQACQTCPTLGEWLERYVAGRGDVRPNTLRNYEQAKGNALEFFGPNRRLDAIGLADAEDFRIWLKTTKGLAEGTIRRRCKRVKQFFAAAIRRKLLSENPFAGIPCSNYSDTSRFHFVSHEEAEAVLDACPDAEWRLIFALARYGGLRVPSELLALRWQDIDWDRARFVVRSPKTEHHHGKGTRSVPIFHELAPMLGECFELAEPGSTFVITRYRDTTQNLRTQLCRIIERAGLDPWPKLFQNCRSTRETELAERFPIHVVCEWIGNSQPVAAKHYLQVTDEHFQKAVRNPEQHLHAGRCKDVSEARGRRRQAARRSRCDSDATPCAARQLDGAVNNSVHSAVTIFNNRQLQRIPPRGLEPLSSG